VLQTINVTAPANASAGSTFSLSLAAAFRSFPALPWVDDAPTSLAGYTASLVSVPAGCLPALQSCDGASAACASWVLSCGSSAVPAAWNISSTATATAVFNIQPGQTMTISAALLVNATSTSMLRAAAAVATSAGFQSA
jgi:hypothetical protein